MSACLHTRTNFDVAGSSWVEEGGLDVLQEEGVDTLAQPCRGAR